MTHALSDGTTPFSTLDALRELSEGAFCVWCGMLALAPSELAQGRRHLARILGYHKRTLDRRLRELRDKGYIRLVMHGWKSNVRTGIIVVRRAKLAGFVRI